MSGVILSMRELRVIYLEEETLLKGSLYATAEHCPPGKVPRIVEEEVQCVTSSDKNKLIFLPLNMGPKKGGGRGVLIIDMNR
jgi:hypothetical protein